MGEGVGARQRLLQVLDRPVSRDAVAAFARGVWKLVFVLVVTLAILFAIGWAIQTVSNDEGSRGKTATTVGEE